MTKTEVQALAKQRHDIKNQIDELWDELGDIEAKLADAASDLAGGARSSDSAEEPTKKKRRKKKDPPKKAPKKKGKRKSQLQTRIMDVLEDGGGWKEADLAEELKETPKEVSKKLKWLKTRNKVAERRGRWWKS